MSSFLKRIVNFFFVIQKDDPEELRKRKVLNILLVGTEFIDGWVILIYFLFLIAGSPIDGLGRTIYILGISTFAGIGGIISFLLNNYLSNKLANINCIVLITIFIYFADTPYELVLGRSLLLLVLPIILAGFLIKPSASFIMSFFIVFVNLLICVIKGFFPSVISLTIYVLIAFMTWFSTINFEKSIEKYREAYNRERFYKDLFAHDTNNILQNILMALEMYELKLSSSTELTDMKSLNLIKTQIERGANLIRNIRIFDSMLESDRLLKKMDLRKVLKEAIEIVKSRIERQVINIQIEDLVHNYDVIADKFLLNIFENILLNSVIHNDNITVEIFIRISSVSYNGKKCLKAEFNDNGVGIPDSRKENIFNRELEGDTSLRGLGLGLPLVKSILDHYNAKIWVENKIPEDFSKGSKFILIFPEVQ